MIMYSYALWIPKDFWFFNQNFLKIWFGIMFLGFFFIPFSEAILFERRSVLERFLLILVFFFLGVDIIQYSLYQWVNLDNVLVTFIMAIFLNFSFNSLNNHSKDHFIKHTILNIVLIVMILIGFFTTDLSSIYYIFINITYVLMICLISLYLFKLRKEVY